MLLVVSGLPGTGKSAVAAEVARKLAWVHLSIDVVEDALLGAGLPPGWVTGVAAYEAVRAAAEQNLALGRSVVVDAVNDSEPARLTWRRAADATGVPLRLVALSPPPEHEHRRRLSGRRRGLQHLPEPTWEEVRARAQEYSPWADDPLVVDAGAPLDAVVDRVIAFVAAATPDGGPGDNRPVRDTLRGDRTGEAQR